MSDPVSGEMDLHPARYELDFEELKATEGYNQPHDFLVRELPLDAGGVLPQGEDTKDKPWYEYPSPLEHHWDGREETERQLQLEEESLRRSLEEREVRRQQLLVDMHQRFLAEMEQQLYKEYSQSQRRWQLQLQYLQLQRQQERRLELLLEERQPKDGESSRDRKLRLHRSMIRQERILHDMQQYRHDIQQSWDEEGHVGDIQQHYHEQGHLDAIQRRFLLEMQQRLREDERHRLRQEQEQDDPYLDAVRTNSSTSECWGSDGETPTYSSSSSSSPARDVPEEHQFHVDEHEFHVEEYKVYVQIHWNDAANIPRYRLFKSEAATDDLRLSFALKIPYYIHAGRCNHKLEGYELRYADFFPKFYRWNHTWVRPTTYEGDDQYVYFFRELLGSVQYMYTKDRVLAKAIAIANKSFRKMLYFQIELAVGDCMMLLEEKEKFQQRYNLYCYIASEIYFKNQKYEDVLEHIKNGHEVLFYELTEFGSDANEDDAWEMREFVDHLVRTAPIQLPSTTRSDHVYKKWVSEQINLQFQPYFHLYINFLVEKINLAQDLHLVPEDAS